MTERDTYRLMRAPLVERGFEITRIENSISSGIPDFYYVKSGDQGWVELKVFRGNNLQHRITPNQEAWIWLHAKAGVRVFIIAGDPKDRSLWIWDGIKVRDFRHKLAREIPPIAVYSKPYDWGEVASCLTD